MKKVCDWVNRLKQWAITFANSNGFIKFIVGLIAWAIALIPVYIASFFFWLLGPVGFWQCFATFLACVIILGIPQLILCIMGVALTIVLIDMN